jgi:ribose/xylose/arabinose/galactoside ABC-type transport system permease subunit
LFTNTRYGFRLYLTGTNAKAAHFAGINNRNILLKLRSHKKPLQ